jgi:hypothetical protein
MSQENTNGQEHAKTPLEMVREQQEQQNAGLAELHATVAQGQAMQQQSHDTQEQHVDTSPEVPGQGPPSTMRQHPQRANRSHNQ